MCIILYYRAFHNGDGCGTCARRGRCRPDFEIVCAPTTRTTGPQETKKKTERYRLQSAQPSSTKYQHGTEVHTRVLCHHRNRRLVR